MRVSRLCPTQMARNTEPPVLTLSFTDAPTARPISDLNSASLERQCRELWKLRATLHDDSCVGDNWTNYHQRLNRRYDSGYKSIENQFSSSIEGNVSLAAAARRQSPIGPSEQSAHGADDQTSARPPSGCSGLVSAANKQTKGHDERLTVAGNDVSQRVASVESSTSGGVDEDLKELDVASLDPVDCKLKGIHRLLKDG